MSAVMTLVCDSCTATYQGDGLGANTVRSEAENLGWQSLPGDPQPTDWCPTCFMERARDDVGRAHWRLREIMEEVREVQSSPPLEVIGKLIQAASQLQTATDRAMTIENVNQAMGVGE